MGKLTDWEEIQPLGGGGQSVVTLMRRPQRKKQREEAFKALNRYSMTNLERSHAEEFARASYEISRPDTTDELGAMKKFTLRPNLPDAAESAAKRLHNEIEVLKQKHDGFLKLLESDESEGWIITEYCENKTLDHHLKKYRGDVLGSITALIPLIETVAYLHEPSNNIIHRDIKPQNIFVGAKGELLLGDFGLVFMPNAPDRITFTGETVGPRDFMPPWVLGIDHPHINGAFDVYMLGKVMWCMISGREKLHREDFDRPNSDLTKIFPKDPDMYGVHEILGRCVVREEEDCLQTAGQLLPQVQKLAKKIKRGGQPVKDKIVRFCHVCGEGEYSPEEGAHNESTAVTKLQLENTKKIGGFNSKEVTVQPYTCNVCGHIQLFKVNEVRLQR